MNRLLCVVTLGVGLATLCWVGVGYVGSNPLALFITVLVGAFYLMGARELYRFHQATATLVRALSDAPEAPSSLVAWLDKIHPTLQHSVRLRIEGERVTLPGPAMTPYLSGLLVLLGMLGTFVGMIVTLKGTGIALQSATDLPSFREALSAPVRGLGLAFGTSVAGVAASAMLGLLSALCRRERQHAAQMLDARVASTWRIFSNVHHREESLKLLQQQAQWMPELFDRLQVWMHTMAQQDKALHERLVAAQDHFHGQAQAAYAGLAASVDQSLKHSLSQSAQQAGALIQPVVEATMAGIARETASLHDLLGQQVQRQLTASSSQLEAAAVTMSGLWTDALADQQRSNAALTKELHGSLDQVVRTFENRFEQQATLLTGRLDQAHAAQQVQHAQQVAQDQQRLAAWTQSLEDMASSLRQAWQQAGTDTVAQLQSLTETLAHTADQLVRQTEAHAKRTLAEVALLVQSTTEAPRAAAEMVHELRQKLSDTLARDNAMLAERGQMLETVHTLLGAVSHASTAQRAAIDELVTGSADWLDRLGQRVTQTLDAQADTMTHAAAQITGSAVEVASLGEAFGFAVQQFSESNSQLVGQLQRIETALSKSLVRSDEQLAYYVAQAREVVDLSISSQKQIIDDLQQIARRQTPEVSEA